MASRLSSNRPGSRTARWALLVSSAMLTLLAVEVGLRISAAAEPSPTKACTHTKPPACGSRPSSTCRCSPAAECAPA